MQGGVCKGVCVRVCVQRCVCKGECVRVCLVLENPLSVALPIEYLALITQAASSNSSVDGGKGGGGGVLGRGGHDEGEVCDKVGGHVSLRLIPTCMELPARPATSTHAPTHASTHTNGQYPAHRGATYEVYLDAVVLAPEVRGGGGGANGSVVGRLKG